MKITHTFGGVPVTDFPTAYNWYVRLFGRAADMFPHDSEAVWRLMPTASVYVVQDTERAGHALVTLAMDDLGAYERYLKEIGLAYTEQPGEGAPRRLLISDDDGNRVALFEDPGSAQE